MLRLVVLVCLRFLFLSLGTCRMTVMLSFGVQYVYNPRKETRFQPPWAPCLLCKVRMSADVMVL